MLECPKCKHDNDLGRIFCVKCGEKLDISKVAPPSGAVRRTRKGKRQFPMKMIVKGAIFKTIKVIFLAAVMALITAILLPPEVQRRSNSEQNFEAYQVKRTELDEGILNEKGVSVVFEEGDLNAMLAQLVKNTPGNSAGKMPLKLESFYISLQDGSAVITSQYKWQYFNLYVQLGVKPVMKGGKCTFQPVAARIGRLRIPPALTPVLDKAGEPFRIFLSGLEAEKTILEKVASVVVKPGQAIVSIQKPSER